MARQHDAPRIPERLRRDIVQHRLHRRCSVAFALLGGVNHHVPNVVFRYVWVVNHHDVSHHPRVSVNAERLALIAVDIRLRKAANRVGDVLRLVILPQGDWIDLCAAETVTMHAGEFRIISLGVSMQLPEGYEAHIVPRSSTFRKWGILQANSMGVIDESYCGDDDVWGFPALAMRDTTIARGDRICQFRVMRKMDKPELVTVERLDNASRGGFGSTGTR